MTTSEMNNKAAEVIRAIAAQYTTDIMVYVHKDCVAFDGDVYDMMNGGGYYGWQVQEEVRAALDGEGLTYEPETYSTIKIYKAE